jgi:hypothetical protein
MFEFFGGMSLGQIFLLFKLLGLLLALIAFGAGIYALKTIFGPTFRIVQWLVGHKPGSQPSDVMAGASHGLRLLAWSMGVAFVIWFFLG